MSNRRKRAGRVRKNRCPECRSDDLTGKVFDNVLYVVCLSCGAHWPADGQEE